MNKILVPFDFSEVSEYALDFAVQLAEKGDADEVLLLNVIDHPTESRLKTMGVTPVDPLENVYFTKLIQVTKDKLDAKFTELNCPASLKYKIKLGSPYHTLIEEVADQDVDLVIMGTSGSEGLDEFFVGSNAEKVVRVAKCPVITTSNKVSVNDVNDIVFASNFSDLTTEFIDKLKELQSFFDATIRVVKINTPASFTTTRQDKSQMEKFVNDFSLVNFSTDIYNYTNEEDGIVLYAEDIDADMIALGTNQRTGFDHFLKGSIAEDVVNHAKRPVWTLHLDA